jgi:cation diffusion facilitator family transporter
VADGARHRLLSTFPSRNHAVSRVLARVLVCNLAIALAKLILGYTTGAVSILSDGFQSLADSAANIIGLAGMRVAYKPPDADHPYGHRKFETLAAAGIFVFMLLAVLEIGRSALHHFYAASSPAITPLTFSVVLATLGVNIAVVRHEASEARRHNSELLQADSVHTRSDVYATIGVLVSLAGVWLGYPLLDPIGGIIIAVLIARTGFEIARDTSGILADRVVIDEDDIRRVVMSVPGVLGCHHIRTRGPADHVFLDLHVWFPADASLTDAHTVSHVVKDRLMEQYPQIADAIIHIEPPPVEA